MTDIEMLAKAVKFNAGLPLSINGRKVTSETKLIPLLDNYFIELMGEDTGWAVKQHMFFLNKKGEWEYPPVNRLDKRYIKRTRFKTAQEAFEVLENWKEKYNHVE